MTNDELCKLLEDTGTFLDKVHASYTGELVIEDETAVRYMHKLHDSISASEIRSMQCVLIALVCVLHENIPPTAVGIFKRALKAHDLFELIDQIRAECRAKS